MGGSPDQTWQSRIHPYGTPYYVLLGGPARSADGGKWWNHGDIGDRCSDIEVSL